MRRPQPRLPVEPLVRRYGSNVSALARALGCHDSHVFRWKREGSIPLNSADRTAVSLGMHPVEVWPEWYEMNAALERSRGRASGVLVVKCDAPGGANRGRSGSASIVATGSLG